MESQTAIAAVLGSAVWIDTDVEIVCYAKRGASGEIAAHMRTVVTGAIGGMLSWTSTT